MSLTVHEQCVAIASPQRTVATIGLDPDHSAHLLRGFNLGHHGDRLGESRDTGIGVAPRSLTKSDLVVMREDSVTDKDDCLTSHWTDKMYQG